MHHSNLEPSAFVKIRIHIAITFIKLSLSQDQVDTHGVWGTTQVVGQVPESIKHLQRQVCRPALLSHRRCGRRWW
jgi:hypothetical protein